MEANEIGSLIQTDVCILGGGPGGAATALQLARLNIPCLVVDKAVFPRDKVCGDALSGKVMQFFDKIDSTIFQDFIEQDALKINCWGIKFIYPKGVEIDYQYKPELTIDELKSEKPVSFVIKRMEFDNYLVNYLKKEPLVDFREDVNITEFEQNENGFLLKNKQKTIQIQAKLVIAADGAQSKFARKIGGIEKDNKHFAGSARAYYKNVKSFTSHNHVELHYIKEFAPGYLWVFPLPNGEANVGVVVRSDIVKKNKKNLRKDIERVLKEHPRFKERFENAEQVNSFQGYGLPYGSKKRKLSGENYMLIGDAASLIDPLTGEGIGNAVVSGRLAALQAAECLKTNNYSASFLADYDKEIYKKLWKELKISYQLQRMAEYPWLVQLMTSLLAKNKNFIEILSSMFTDVDLRKKLKSPKFYFGLIFNR